MNIVSDVNYATSVAALRMLQASAVLDITEEGFRFSDW